jgi:hypothetical protein
MVNYYIIKLLYNSFTLHNDDESYKIVSYKIIKL